MTIQTAIWVPPSLCGCQLRITADWTDGSIVNGISHRHPVPFTIKDIQIDSVCADHHDSTKQMPDVSRHYEEDKFTGEQVQHRGYLQHPIDNPTEAQCLYEFLCAFNGQIHTLDCGCSGYQVVEPNKDPEYKVHPVHGRKCKDHKHDSIEMHEAKATHDAKVQLQLTQEAEAVADLAPAA